jgi:ABC-type Zn uptake system ZnuABC Zn-binding protein ZnuA
MSLHSRFPRLAFLLLAVLAAACSPSTATAPAGATGLRVVAVESFMADMAQNVAGDRLTVDALIPVGVDPHSFTPTPQDAARIADSQVLIVNGAGLETWLEKVLQNAGGSRQVLVASDGLTNRAGPGASDPHFWLDPQLAVHYVENIRDGLSRADPAGAEVYARNASAYIARLKELDSWITAQVAQIPADRRLLVTNHEAFGYYANRYGFRIAGSVIPSFSSEASPSAQQLAALVDAIRQTGVRAIFVEVGANPQLAEQIGQETGVKVISDLYTHSPSAPNGPAPTYIDMLKYDTVQIVTALKQP